MLCFDFQILPPFFTCPGIIVDSIFVSPSSSPTLAPSFSPIKTPTASPIDSMEESIALWSRKDAGDVSAQQGVVVSASTNNIGYFDNGGE